MRATDPPQHLLYFDRDPWPWGKPHEAAGIHRTSQQLGSSVSACGARAAAGDAGDRVSPYRLTRSIRPCDSGFRRGLAKSDFVEGRNVAVEYRWGEGQLDRMPSLLADLLDHQVSINCRKPPGS